MLLKYEAWELVNARCGLNENVVVRLVHVGLGCCWSVGYNLGAFNVEYAMHFQVEVHF